MAFWGYDGMQWGDEEKAKFQHDTQDEQAG